MTQRTQNLSDSHISSFYECQFQLSEWIHGTNSLQEITTTVNRYARMLQQLYHWKKQGLLLPKPTLSLPNTFVFWAEKSIINAALSYEGIRGGFQVQNRKFCLSDSSSYKGKKAHPRPRRVLLDIGCDSHSLVRQLEQLGLEVVRLWDHAADLLHYEIIELCTAQYIDLLVTTNEKLLMPTEEWIDYLLPHRTRVFISPQSQSNNPENFSSSIYFYAHKKRTFKIKNQLINLRNPESHVNKKLRVEKHA